MIEVLKSLASTNSSNIMMLDTMKLNRSRKMLVNSHMNVLILANVNSDEVIGSCHNLSFEVSGKELFRLRSKFGDNLRPIYCILRLKCAKKSIPLVNFKVKVWGG